MSQRRGRRAIGVSGSEVKKNFERRGKKGEKRKRGREEKKGNCRWKKTETFSTLSAFRLALKGPVVVPLSGFFCTLLPPALRPFVEPFLFR